MVAGVQGFFRSGVCHESPPFLRAVPRKEISNLGQHYDHALSFTIDGSVLFALRVFVQGKEKIDLFQKQI